MANAIFVRADDVERRLCIAMNRAARRPAVRRIFAAVSRLGDGVFWYCLMGVIALAGGRAGTALAAQMAATGLAGLMLYKGLKNRLVRERPYVLHDAVECLVAPLDRYSFPSGHTLHAVLFTTLAVSHLPIFALVLVPFAVLVAMSRVILGLHYPSDVLVGAALGGGLAWASDVVVATL